MKTGASRSGTATTDPRRTLWNHFVLVRAVERLARAAAEGVRDCAIPFCYVDTHAGSGSVPHPGRFLDRILEQRASFSSETYFQAIAEQPKSGGHPGSWLLAGRVVQAVAGDRLVVEMDVNDIDSTLVTQARANREGTWVRFWSHDWFSFLRSHLSLTAAPNMVFIDPPPDDARGPGYAIDAALLLETMKVPYMISYSADAPQEPIDEIGRTGLELAAEGAESGVLLGGGAESVLLDILPDLRLLAGLLDGQLVVRLPRHDDYTI